MVGQATTRQRIQSCQWEILCCALSCSKIKERWEDWAANFVVGHCLCCGLKMGHGELLCLHKVFLFVFSLFSATPPIMKLFLSWPVCFFAFTLSFLFLHSTVGRREQWRALYGMLSCLTHNSMDELMSKCPGQYRHSLKVATHHLALKALSTT